jgi:class 3 adenylate cyclase
VAARELRYRFAWRLASPPAVLWPYVADTNRFNRDAGIPQVEVLAVEQGGTGRRSLRLRGPRPLRYEETPFEWVRPERFGVTRTYPRGPLAELRALVRLVPEGTGTELVYDVAIVPRGLAGRLAAAVVVGRVYRRRFGRAFRRYDALASGAPAIPAAPAQRPALAPGGLERLARARAALEGERLRRELIDRLVEAVTTAPEPEAGRLRPFALADAWGEPRRETLELFLHATRAGLLASRWELVCPHCRGAAAASDTLAGVRAQAHCDACALDFEVAFDRQLELVFRPGEAIRETADAQYCVAGPGLQPHVVVQQALAPGERRTLRLALEPGAYRARARGLAGSRRVAVDPGAPPDAELRLDPAGAAGPEIRVAPRARLTLVNDSVGERLLALERTAWADDAATAADVTALQAFRDLFASEALRPGEELAVGSLTVVFTDLRGSTSLYRQIGDAPAFGSVSSHFDVLREAIRAEGGSIVKTIGDAVMAVFRRPAPALRALRGAQRRLADGAAGRPLALKVGVHVGPCIAVTLNDRLDYFGSTVNAAARLVSLSSGEDLVLSEAVREDPEVAEELATAGHRLEPADATLRGFEGERFTLWRLAGA